MVVYKTEVGSTKKQAVGRKQQKGRLVLTTKNTKRFYIRRQESRASLLLPVRMEKLSPRPIYPLVLVGAEIIPLGLNQIGR